MLRILGNSSSINVRKVLWLCAELELRYEHEQWGTGARSTATPEFLALNPNAKVPCHRGWPRWCCGSRIRSAGISPASMAEPICYRPIPRPVPVSSSGWTGRSTELNNAWRYAFKALARKSQAHVDPQAIAASVADWNRHMQILDAQLERTGAYAAGSTFTLADIVLGLSTNRWFMTPMERPQLPAVQAYLERLSERPYSCFTDGTEPHENSTCTCLLEPAVGAVLAYCIGGAGPVADHLAGLDSLSPARAGLRVGVRVDPGHPDATRADSCLTHLRFEPRGTVAMEPNGALACHIAQVAYSERPSTAERPMTDRRQQ